MRWTLLVFLTLAIADRSYAQNKPPEKPGLADAASGAAPVGSASVGSDTNPKQDKNKPKGLDDANPQSSPAPGSPTVRVTAKPDSDDTAWTFVLGNQSLTPVNADALWESNELWKNEKKLVYARDKCEYQLESQDGSREFVVLQLITSNDKSNVMNGTTQFLTNILPADKATLNVGLHETKGEKYVVCRTILQVLNDLRRKYPPWGIVIVAEYDVIDAAIKCYSCHPERSACLISLPAKGRPRPFPIRSEAAWFLSRPRPGSIPGLFFVMENTVQYGNSKEKIHVSNKLNEWNISFMKDYCRFGALDNLGNNKFDILEWEQFIPRTDNKKTAPNKQVPIASNTKQPIDVYIKNMYAKILKDKDNIDKFQAIKVFHTQTNKLESEWNIIQAVHDEICDMIKDERKEVREQGYFLLSLSLLRWRDWTNVAEAKQPYLKLRQLAQSHPAEMNDAYVNFFKAHDTENLPSLPKP